MKMSKRQMASSLASFAPSGSEEQKLFRLAEDHYEAGENCTGPYLYQAKKSEYAKARRAFVKAVNLRELRVK